MNASGRTVLAVVVAYLPDASALSELLHALLEQVDQVLIVDNTPAADDRVWMAIQKFPELESTLRLVRLGNNLGIAAALNVGIQAAVTEGFEYVLLSDQDSQPAPDMCAQLLSVSRRLYAMGVRIGCIGPAYVDRVTGQTFGFQVQEPGRVFYSTRAGYRADPWVEVITQITSGSLIPCAVFADVGLMREDYFIDYVDTEWCHRARYHGHKLFGTSLARMEHRVGDGSFHVWYGRWKTFNGYSPLRLHYRFRNGVFLLRSCHVPLRWKLRSGWTWVGNIYAYTLFASQRIDNLKAIIRGIRDGICGRAGPVK